MITRRFKGSLWITLAANEVFQIRFPGRPVLRVTMAADEASVAVESMPYTQLGASPGETGWGSDVPRETERIKEKGIDHDLRPSPAHDIRGATP